MFYKIKQQTKKKLKNFLEEETTKGKMKTAHAREQQMQ